MGVRRVGARRVGGPKFRAFFPSPATKFVLLFPLWGSSRGFLVVFGSARAVKCARLEFSGCCVKPRRPQSRLGFTQQPESPNVHSPTRDWQCSNYHKLEAQSKSQCSVYNIGRVVKRTHSVFYWWAKCRRIRVSSLVCCGEVAMYSCARLHRQTVKSLPPPTCVVSSSMHLFGWTDHGAVTASNGANTTKMRSHHGQKDQTNECS